MKKKTKIFALLSALFIAFAILPEKVMAQDPNSPPPPQYQSTPPPQQDPNAPPPQQDPNAMQQAPPQEEPQNGDYQEFYSQLSPYGQWVDEPTYGYVFIPTVGPGFYPYRSRGHWEYTDMGWTWVSNYPFGWACFHYGRWNFDNVYGWFWIPGSVWAPAWVAWGGCPGYYGWAPLGFGMRIGVRYDFPADHWCFLRAGYMGRADIYHYYEPRGNNGGFLRNHFTYINETHINNGRSFYSGPRVEEVQRYTGAPIHSVAIRESPTPGRTVVNGNQVNMYKPQVRPVTAGAHPAPQNHMPINQAPSLSQRNAAYRQAHPANAAPARQAAPQQTRQAAPQQRQAAPQQQRQAAPQQQRQAAPQQRQAPMQRQASMRQAPQQREAPRQEGGGGRR